MDKVFTCLDFNYFNSFGISWIASIRTLGQYSGPIYIVLLDQFPQFLLDKFAKENIHVLYAYGKPKSRETAFEVLQNNATSGTFAYWDADGYFMNPITDLPIGDKLLFVKDTSGFVAGNADSLDVYVEYNKLNDFCGFKRDSDLHKYFPNLVDFLGTEWNYCNAHRSLPKETKFVHFADEIKNLSFMRDNLSFAVKYPEIQKEWAAKFHISTAKKLFRKARNE